MSLGKLSLGLLVIFSLSAHADDKKKSVARLNHFFAGAGYMTFTEPLKMSDATQTEEGYANYAGLTALVGYRWYLSRWEIDTSAGVASGKATAGGFTLISYPDAGRRSWNIGYAEIAANYRLSGLVSLGVGLLPGIRNVDWKSETNTTLTSGLATTIFWPEILLRLNFNRTVGISQAIIPIGLKGATAWRWLFEFNF